MKKKVLIAVVILLVIYIVFVTVDCIRLRNAKRNTQPLISFSIKDYETDGRVGSIYSGLGYNIEYYKIKNTAGGGAEFKLFNLIPIWSWEEH